VFHVYALLEDAGPLPAVDGVGGAPVRAVAVAERLFAVVSDVRERFDATEAAIVAHAAVTDALAGEHDAVLPVRFGPALADERELEEALAPRRRHLAAAFDRIRGCAEMGLRVLRPQSSGSGAAESGKAYMQRRLADVREAERLVAELEQAYAEIARASSHRVLASAETLVVAAYLLPRSETARFRTIVRDVEQAHPELAFVATGPWPPYSFALAEVDGG
jgi:hypothetical protein